MKFSFQLRDVDSMKATMTITMTVGDWKKLKELTDSKYPYPGGAFGGAIYELVAHAERNFRKEQQGEK